MRKKVKWDLIEYNHKIAATHIKNCIECHNSVDTTYCIVCGEHKPVLSFCYWCGDVVCGMCCPINLPSHQYQFVCKKDKK